MDSEEAKLLGLIDTVVKHPPKAGVNEKSEDKTV